MLKSAETPSRELRAPEWIYWLGFFAFDGPEDAWRELSGFVSEVETALQRRRRLDEDVRARELEAARSARDEASKLLSKALELGLERRIGRCLRDPIAVGIANTLRRLGASESRALGVCEGCGLIWRRPDRKNLAHWCPDCSHRQLTPGEVWEPFTRDGDDRLSFRPLPQMREQGLKAFAVQPCDTCGKGVEVSGLRDRAFCDGACKLRAKRRRDTGLPERDARDPSWVDMTWFHDAGARDRIKAASCVECGDEHYRVDARKRRCPRCRDVAAGHLIYEPGGEPQGWCGTTEPSKGKQ